MGRPGWAGGDAAPAAGRLVAAQCLSSSSLPISAFISQFLLICSPSLQVLLPTSIRELLFPLSITPACVEHFCVPGSALGTPVGWGGVHAAQSTEMRSVSPGVRGGGASPLLAGNQGGRGI